MRNTKQSMTVIEWLIVAAIVCILASIVVPLLTQKAHAATPAIVMPRPIMPIVVRPNVSTPAPTSRATTPKVTTQPLYKDSLYATFNPYLFYIIASNGKIYSESYSTEEECNDNATSIETCISGKDLKNNLK
jgi:hypothetical protein